MQSIYALHAMDKDASIIAALFEWQQRQGATQVELAGALGIHQGHLSKVMAGKVPLSRKLGTKAEMLLKGVAPRPDMGEFETAVLHAVRTSSSFRTLVRAAMQLHGRKDGRAS